MGFLQQHVDPSLPVRKADTQDSLSKKETDRLNELYFIAIAAMDMPRRVGAEASAEELSIDKRNCRRVAHVANQCLKAWGAAQKPLSRNINRSAAQVHWKTWLEDHRTYLDGRMRYIATWQYKTGGDEKWAKSALVRLGNELRWLEYGLRDAQ